MMNENIGLTAIPDDLLESIAGGVLTDADRECIRHTAQNCKEENWSVESVLWMYALAIKLDGTAEDVADFDEIESIVRQVYGE